jgi:isoprenylcysteine carboxyl methyltransferase (ICMT) family protein YpbQ
MIHPQVMVIYNVCKIWKIKIKIKIKDEVQMISKVGLKKGKKRMHGIVLFHVLIFVFEHVSNLLFQ